MCVCVCVCVFAKYNGKLLKDFQKGSTFLFEKDDSGKLVRRSLLKFGASHNVGGLHQDVRSQDGEIHNGLRKDVWKKL